MSQRCPPVALTVAGSDSSAGAGMQADLKTFRYFDVYGVCAVTCVVSELPGQVRRLDMLQTGMLVDQMTLLLAHFPISAAKTGLLPTEAMVAAAAEIFRDNPAVQLVVDPVMVASSGDRLMAQGAQFALETQQIPHASLVTPNLDEAAAFWGRPIPDEAAMAEAGAELSSRWGVAVLMKGGHLRGEVALDLLFEPGASATEFRSPYMPDVETHGTGCTLSAAIAALLARRRSLVEACREAKSFVTAAIEQRFQWQSRSGSRLAALNHSPSR